MGMKNDTCEYVIAFIGKLDCVLNIINIFDTRHYDIPTKPTYLGIWNCITTKGINKHPQNIQIVKVPKYLFKIIFPDPMILLL